MATESAVRSETTQEPARRQYWQLPMFVLGLTALILAWKSFPTQAASPRERFDRDLKALRSAYEKRPLDVANVQSAIQTVSNNASQFPDDAARVQYLLGSAHLMLAEWGPHENAAEEWHAAHAEFAKCDVLKLADKPEQQRCVFRSAKAAAATGVGDAAALLAALTVVPSGEDPGERSRLLAETHLRTVPPDLKKARDEFAAFLSGANRLPSPAQAKYKLKLAELCLSLNEIERGRSWLKEIGANAPPDIHALAKVQLGRLAAAENNWQSAVKFFEEAQSTKGVSEEQLAVIRYETGRGWIALNNPLNAAPCFEQAEKMGGAVATAARLRLAEIAARDATQRGNRAKAAEWIVSSVQGLGSAAEFRNSHISIDELRAGFEEVIRVSTNENDHASAFKVASAFPLVAQTGRDRELRAEINTSWAVHLEAKPETAPQAKAKRLSAAEDYLALASEQSSPSMKVDSLRKASMNLAKAGDEPGALKSLEQLLGVPGISADQKASAYLEKGEILLASAKHKEAIDAFEEAKKHGGTAATLAQVKQARTILDEGKRLRAGNKTNDPQVAEEAKAKIEHARQALNLIAGKTYETAVERESQEVALFELGKMYVHVYADFMEAEPRFSQLIQMNTNGRYVEDAKLYLGTCLLENTRGESALGTERKLREALALFRDLQASKHPKLQTQGDLRYAMVMLKLRQFDDLPKVCTDLSAKYKGQVEEIILLSILVAGYKQADRPKQADETRQKMTEAYQALPDAAFTGLLGEYTREYWERVHGMPKK